MKTKDVLLVIGGVALGYLASRKNWGKRTADAVGSVATGVTGVATGIVSDVKDVAVDTAKAVECEKKWTSEVGSVSKFASAEAMQSSKDAYVKNCMAS